LYGKIKQMLKGLRSLSQAIDKFRTLDDAIPARVMHTFVCIAGWEGDEGPSMSELATMVGLNPGVVTRHVTALTETHRLGKPGLNVVEVRSDVDDPRMKRVRLTQKGRTLRSQLLTIMEQ
jgi:DNA-binding MarR family transcriptional regulator